MASFILTIDVNEARDLQAADPNGFSDPYALISVGRMQPKKSKIIKKTLNPKWNQTFQIEMNKNDSKLHVEVWDWDAIGSDDFLGMLDIDISDIASGSKKEMSGWYTLKQDPKKPKIKVTGDISLKIVAKSLKEKSNKSVQGINKEIEKKIISAKQNAGPLILSSMDIDKLGFIGDNNEFENIQLNLNNLSEFPTEALQSNAGTLQILNLSGNSLTSFPSSGGIFNQLTELFLNGNRITSISPEIAKLQSLEKLNLANNSLTSIPATIGYLKNLDDLNLGGNQLEGLPDSIGNLWRLEVIDLSCNELKSIPEEFTYMTRLMDINLGANHLRCLPEAVGRLSRVVNLNIADNNISKLPLSIGYCVGLKQIGQGLNIERNPLEDQELEKNFKVGADRLFVYLERLMMMHKDNIFLPAMPNNGIPPYVPMLPVNGLVCSGQHSAGWNKMATGQTGPTNPQQPPQKTNSGSGLNRTITPTKTGLNINNNNNPPNRGSSGTGSGSGSGSGNGEERAQKIETLRKAIGTVITNDINPKIAKLKILIESSTSTQNIQPFVTKVKDIKVEIEALKLVIPPLDKMTPPEKKQGEEPLVSLKKIIGAILFEYELVLSITTDVSRVANEKDVLKIVSTLKVLKQKLLQL